MDVTETDIMQKNHQWPKAKGKNVVHTRQNLGTTGLRWKKEGHVSQHAGPFDAGQTL